MAKSKPSFKAKLKPSQKVADFAQYIEQDAKWAEEAKQETAPEQLPTPKERKPRNEKRIARIQLCLTESLKEDVSKAVTMCQFRSVNDFICKVLEDYVNDHREQINKYDEVFGGGTDE